MVVSAARNTQTQLIGLLKSDFTGKGNFIYWLISILAIGAVGYIPDLKPVSRAFLVLVVIVLILKNGGVFTQFLQAINGTQSVNAGSNTQQSSQGTSRLTTQQTTQNATPNSTTDSLDGLGELAALA
jgi:hypothetical protein